MDANQAGQPHLPPQNIEAEAALLGAILIDPDAMLRAREVDLQPSDFYREVHGQLFAAALTLTQRFEPVDILTVTAVLDGNGQLEAIGGPPALTGLVADTVSTVNAREYAVLVKRAAQQRCLIATCGEIVVASHGHEGPIEELYETVSAAFFEAVDVSAPRSHLYGTDDALIDYETYQLQRAERLKANPDFMARTGYMDVDAVIGDLPENSLTIIGAAPSVGKTIMMEGIAEYNAQRGHRVAFYHLELSHQFMLDRRMARYSGIPLHELKRGYNGPETSRATNAIAAWQQNMVYVHCPGWTAERIASDMTRLHARGECDLAIVDYLGKIRKPEGAFRGRNEASVIGGQLEVVKNCAENLGIPVVMGSQVNRERTKRLDKRPQLSDLRGSGEIEERANLVIMLHRKWDRRAEQKQPEHGAMEPIEVFVDKNTQGAVGSMTLYHRQGHFQFVAMAKGERVPDEELEMAEMRF